MEEKFVPEQNKKDKILKEKENILNWYPFEKTGQVLEVDAKGGLLTGMLCDKVEQVVALEWTEENRVENLKKNGSKKNLRVLSGYGEEFKSTEKFDYIILHDGFAEAVKYVNDDSNPYEVLLGKLYSFLKPTGILLLSIENRLGLKYFNGAKERNSHAIFEGINDYADSQKTRTFTKSEWEHLLKKCKIDTWKFYYPYPNHLVPNEIFTDETILRMNYGKAYYEFFEDRIEFFNEESVARSLEEEGVLSSFANSFLLEVRGREFQEKNTIQYVKINSDRNEEFRIATAIVKEKEKIMVYKYPLGESAKRHMKDMYRHEVGSKNETIKSLIGEWQEEIQGERYLFLQSPTLDTMLKEAIWENDKSRIQEILDNLFEKYFEGRSTQNEYRTEEFKQIFGTVGNCQMESVKPANIDLICENVFCEEDGFYVIDSEWIFDIYIPKKFIIWRNLNEIYCKHNELERSLPEKELFEHYKITEQEAELFRNWNRHFTLEYVGANQLEQEARGKRFVSLDLLLGNSILRSALYIDRGTGFSEEEKVVEKALLNGRNFSICYSVKSWEKIKRLRFDPVEKRFCMCKAYIEYDGKIERLKAENSWGHKDGCDVFLNYDPKYIYPITGLKSGEIRIFGEFCYLDSSESDKFSEIQKERELRKERYIQILEDNIRENSDILSSMRESKMELEEKVHAMENTKGWRTLEKIRKIRNRMVYVWRKNG